MIKKIKTKTTIDAFFIGPTRTMTSFIMHNLSHHPHIAVDCMTKETKFFGINYQKPGYLDERFIPGVTNMKYVYCNPHYCNMEYVRDRIYDHNPHAKIFMGLRHPIHRAISHYGVMRHNNMPIGRVREIWDEFDENYRTFRRRKIISEGDYIPWVNEYDSCYIPQYMEMGLYYSMYRMWKQKFVDVIPYIVETSERDKIFFINTILRNIGVREAAPDMIFQEPVHSLKHNMEAEFDFETLTEIFKLKYPDIVFQYELEAMALSKELSLSGNLWLLWEGVAI